MSKGELGQAIPLEDAEELAAWGSTDQFEFVADENLGDSRWESNHLIVFRDKEDDSLLSFVYSTGLTECQEGCSFNGQNYGYSEGNHYVSVVPATFETKTIRVYREA